MAGTRRILAALTVVTTMAFAETDAQAEAPPELMLSLDNVAQASAAVVDEAKEMVIRIYRMAGIDVHWKAGGADFTVVIAPPPHPAPIRDSTFALGYVRRTKLTRGHVAYALADRIAMTSRGLSMPEYVVLGITMAHELGHLLLPNDSHAVNGIMRNDWTQSDYQKARLGQLLFSQAEARIMRAELARVKPRPAPECPGD